MNTSEHYKVSVKRKKLHYILFLVIVILVLLIALLKLVGNSSTMNNASANTLYKNDTSIDLFVYQNTAFVKADQIEWILQLQLTPNNLLGSIQRNNIKKNFSNFDATILEVGTKIYSTLERDDIVLILVNGEYIPYFNYIEG